MTARDVDDMEDIIDDLLMRRKSGKYIAQTLVSCGFGRLPVPKFNDWASVDEYERDTSG